MISGQLTLVILCSLQPLIYSLNDSHSGDKESPSQTIMNPTTYDASTNTEISFRQSTFAENEVVAASSGSGYSGNNLQTTDSTDSGYETDGERVTTFSGSEPTTTYTDTATFSLDETHSGRGLATTGRQRETSSSTPDSHSENLYDVTSSGYDTTSEATAALTQAPERTRQIDTSGSGRDETTVYEYNAAEMTTPQNERLKNSTFIGVESTATDVTFSGDERYKDTTTWHEISSGDMTTYPSGDYQTTAYHLNYTTSYTGNETNFSASGSGSGGSGLYCHYDASYNSSSDLCVCNEGFTGNGTTCEDINECLNVTCQQQAECQNFRGSYSCICEEGYTGNDSFCSDFDECDSNHKCHGYANCSNSKGSYNCSCNNGFTGDGFHCEDIDECDDVTCHIFGECRNLPGSYRCGCRPGFTGNGTECTDIIECNMDEICHEFANCSNFIGNYTCLCHEGYTGDGRNCSDIDECDGSLHDCHDNATCTNTEPFFNCSCDVGFSGNGTFCYDVNECNDSMTCHDFAACTNSVGSYACSCNEGYQGDGKNCTDIDECNTNTTCHLFATCNNTAGNYTCSCNLGYSGNGENCEDVDECRFNNTCHEDANCTNSAGSFDCVCLDGFTGNGTNCNDIDECALDDDDDGDDCHVDATCTNTKPHFNCACHAGYTGNGTFCADIDECLRDQDNDCHEDANCSNSIGSYSCKCKLGYSGDGFKCMDIDECALDYDDGDDCHVDATCTNTKPHFNCTCKTGYRGNGTFCEDIDECALDLDNCHVDATCTNTKPHFNCACKAGYRGNGTFCEDIDECLSNPCKYQGIRSTCSNLINEFKCECKNGFTGDGKTICGRADRVRLRALGENKTRIEPFQGFVEILAHEDEEWKKICEPNWGETESEVVCKQLSFTNSSFLESTLNTTSTNVEGWLDKSSCNGGESLIQDCDLGIFGNYNCSSSAAAKVRCSNTTIEEGVVSMKYRYAPKEGEIREYNFECYKSEAQRVIPSKENCENAGTFATIIPKRNSNNNDEIEFDIFTWKEFDCEAKFFNLNSQITEKVDDQIASKVLGDLSATTGSPKPDQPDSIKPSQVSDLVIHLNKQMNNSGNCAGKNTVFYLVWVTNNLRGMAMAENSSESNNDTLNDAKKLQFLSSLNEIVSAKCVDDDDKLIVPTSSVILKIQKDGSTIEFGNDDDRSLTPAPGKLGNETKHTLNQKVVVRFLGTQKSGSRHIAFKHDYSTLFPKTNESDTVVTQVVTTLSHGENEGSRIQIDFTNNETLPDAMTANVSTEKFQKLFYRQCCLLDSNEGRWRKEGCKTELIKNVIVCNCKLRSSTQHGMHAFTTLLKTYDVDSSIALGIAGYVGCALSATGLVILLSTFISLEKLRSCEINQLHMLLSLSLLMGYITFMVGIERNRHHNLCIAAAAILHFSWLSAWGWMLVESITMLRKFTQVVSTNGPRYILKCVLGVYLVSATIVIANVSAAMAEDSKRWQDWSLVIQDDINFRPSVYVADKSCWLHGNSLYYGFLTPIGIILLLNFFSCILIMRTISSSGKKIRSTKPSTEVKEHLIRTAMLSTLLGISWIFGIPLTLTGMKAIHQIFGWLFTLFNAYQGFFIFILFCVRNSEVRRSLSSKIKSIKFTKRDNSVATSSVYLSSDNASLPVGTPEYHKRNWKELAREFKANTTSMAQ